MFVALRLKEPPIANRIVMRHGRYANEEAKDVKDDFNSRPSVTKSLGI